MILKLNKGVKDKQISCGYVCGAALVKNGFIEGVCICCISEHSSVDNACVSKLSWF